MCGSCGDDDPDIPLIEGHHNCCRLGLHINDVVCVTERRGERGRVGFFEDIDLRWGVAFVWTDGSRTWYPRSRWCRDDESGWEVKLVTPDLFQVEVGVDGVGVVAPRLALEEAGFSVAPPEPGRGWGPRPPPRAQPPMAAPPPAATAAPPPPPDALQAMLCEPDDDSDGG